MEILAVFHALRSFASHLLGCDILLRVDNSTALSHINRMESIKFPHLSGLAREMWCWYRDIFIYASYIPSVQNIEADAESRVISVKTEWSLDQSYFDRIASFFGPFEIDLFASSINTKCPCFVCWLPDPLSWIAVDAFSLDWSKFFFYAFPPFILILKVIRKIITDRAEEVVVVAGPTNGSPYLIDLHYINRFVLNRILKCCHHLSRRPIRLGERFLW